MEPRPANTNFNICIAVLCLLYFNTGTLQMKEFQKVDEVALHKAQAAQIIQLVFAEMQGA